MFTLIINLFRLKAKSLREFAEIVKREECAVVSVRPYQTAKGGANTAAVGLIAEYHYLVEYVTTTSRGRKVIYRERLFERFGSDRGFGDAEDRRDAAIRLFLLGEQKMKELQDQLPGASVELIGLGDRPMDGNMFAQLHQEATRYGVSV